MRTRNVIIEMKELPETRGIMVQYEDKAYNVLNQDWFGILTLKEAPAMSRETAQVMLDEVLKDVRLSYPPANIDINGPLALIQVELATKRDLLKLFLGVK